MQVPTHYAIVANKNFNEPQKASVILHEIGHILCGHLGRDKDNKAITVPDRRNDNLVKDTMEFEAEKVCEIVSKILCIDCNSEAYLQNYTDDGVEPPYSLRIVIEAADKVIKYFSLNESL